MKAASWRSGRLPDSCGVTGNWIDDDDGGTSTMDDIFFCTGFGLVNVYVRG